ncbi:MAG: DUF359 domain-containing protein [Cenarchaeum sp. SB0663_bin_5]|nr:DUF359 domain-containing protein [Cenarchaeum sp. SB0663_bin_5]MYH04388.1 DUF359 domain-containing protein [Cenarchaeum sp. SB0675_bin_21]MYL12078.1 DUF359 domain-containing protein [Cenarchaeum sp. SB0669_bin_11]
MILPEKHRHLFTNPMGELIDDSKVSRDYIIKKIDNAPHVITVGDRTTERLLSFGIIPDLQIVDGLEKRRARPLPQSSAYIVTCKNPPSHITDDAISTIIEAYASERPICIRVHGEEDLLLIPALIHAPDHSLLMYGQPNHGLVLVRADPVTRNRAQQLLELLERDDETVAV